MEATANISRSLLDGVVHDLRTPLAVISGSAELLEVYADDPEEVRRTARTIAANARRLSVMAEGLLEADRRCADEWVEAAEPVDLAGLLADVAADTRLMVGPDVEVEARGCGVVVSEPLALRRLLLNLAANAARHTRTGNIQLVSFDGTDTTRISVVDTGPGMDPAQVARFTRDFSRSESSDGFGLGLSIVRRLARHLDADISIDTAPGQGTSFTIVLPATGCSRSTQTSSRRVAGTARDPVRRSTAITSTATSASTSSTSFDGRDNRGSQVDGGEQAGAGGAVHVEVP